RVRQPTFSAEGTEEVLLTRFSVRDSADRRRARRQIDQLLPCPAQDLADVFRDRKLTERFAFDFSQNALPKPALPSEHGARSMASVFRCVSRRGSAIIDGRGLDFAQPPLVMTRRISRSSQIGTAAAVALSCAILSAQTVVKAPDNRYTPAQDVEAGREAAQ